ncbi:MAG: hypothetical protein J0I82_02070, partial [Spirosoma sp.]|uniref:hypothetical protein n=1 Tax=Spirosoma sp. TaxID=1899569 RepID=UPI001ACBCBDC
MLSVAKTLANRHLIDPHPTPTGVDGERVTSLNETNFQPLHPCLVGLTSLTTGRAPCRKTGKPRGA